MGDLTKNFSSREFACRCGCGLQTISMELVDTLQHVRDNYPSSISITSGTRCVEHKRNVGGSASSSHLTGPSGISFAVDLYCQSSASRYMLIRTLIVYFVRIGIAEKFIHVDIDFKKSGGVLWTYPYKEKEK